MVAGTASRRTRHQTAIAARVGWPVLLIIVWLAAEYWRPPSPMKIPFLISLTLGGAWVLMKRKKWNPQVVLFLVLIGQMVIMIPFTENNYSARLTTREAFTVIVCIAIPMIHFIDTLQRFRIVLGSWIAIFVYMAIVAIFNGGIGPGGAAGGVDENYTALFMTVALSFSYFTMVAAKSRTLSLVLLSTTAAFAVAIVMGSSRGGFLGLIGVAAFCWWMSPRKVASLAVAALVAVAVVSLAPETYWEEIRSIADTGESTASLRFTFWKIAWWIYLDHPILGVGPGNFPWVSGAYQSVNSQGTALGMNVTHSLYFELLAELGTVGFIVFGSIVYFNARDIRLVHRIARRAEATTPRGRNRRPPPRERVHLSRLKGANTLASGLAAAFIGFFICSGFLSTLYYTTFWLLTAMTVALRETTLREARTLRRIRADGAGSTPLAKGR